MKAVIKEYKVKVIREPGNNPVTGQFMAYDEQTFIIDATSRKAAFSISHLICTLPFFGQLRRTFIDEEEYFDKRY